MISNKTTRKQPSKLVLVITFLVAFFWIAVVITGVRLPYIYTEFSFQFRMFILFPILFCVLCYFMFFHHFKGYKVSAYNLKMKEVSSGRDKIKEKLILIVGLVFIPAIISWTSITFPVWITKLVATEPYLQNFNISKIKDRGSSGVELVLLSANTTEQVTLHLSNSRYRKKRWSRDDKICIKGRTSVFGTISDYEARSCTK